MSPTAPQRNPFDRWARSESGLHLPSRLVPRAAKRLHHIEKFGTAQCCCGGGGCTCDGCLDGIAACCYIITIGETEHLVMWNSSCIWENPPDGTAMTMTIADGTMSLTVGATVYSASFPSSTNCETLSAFELSEEGGSGKAYVTAAGNTCLKCECYCSECADTGTSYNAACCWRVYLNANTYYVLSKSDDCLWEDVGGCGVSISVGSGNITLTASGQTWTINYGETPPNCCDTLDFSGESSYPIAYPGSAEGCEDNRKCYCIALTISGIQPYNGDCGCPACSSIDGSYYSYICSEYSYFPGVHDYIQLCTASKPFWRCGYDQLEIRINGVTNAITATIRRTEIIPLFSQEMIFTGTLDTETMTATLTLSSQTGNSTDDCDGSAATITVAVSDVGHYNCPDFNDCPHTQYATCEQPEWNCLDGCWGASIPNQIAVTFPAGYIDTNTERFWLYYGCNQPAAFCTTLPDDVTVILDNYGINEQTPGTFSVPDVGEGSLDGQSLFGDEWSEWDVITSHITIDSCLYLYVSDILESETCFIGGGTPRYEKVYLQWGVFYRLGVLLFMVRTKLYRAFDAFGDPGYTWELTSSREDWIKYALTLEEPCDSENKVNCWTEGNAARGSYSISGAHRCYPKNSVASLAVECL